MTGMKFDDNKPIAGTVIADFALALKAVVGVGTFGAQKYDKSNWLLVDNATERYTDAMLRHYLDERDVYDSESGLLHAAHLAWNALARLELMLRDGNFQVEGKRDYAQIINPFDGVIPPDDRGTGASDSGQVVEDVYDESEFSLRHPKEDLIKDAISSLARRTVDD